MELAEEMRMPVMFWNFNDDIVGYIPESLASYPLGMPKMEEGTILK